MAERDPGLRVAIIGSGFSGLCLAIQLKKAGIESFSIFEKSDRIGGTWRDNDYPGAACDAASFLYCFSFEQKTDWSRKWAPQAEILDYMQECAHKYGLFPHVRFGAEIAGARFDSEAGVWHIRTTGGDVVDAEVLVSGVGQLSRPYTPDLPGLGTFEGESFHSARWNHGYDLSGKSVAVIGNAASAIQFVPRIAKRAARLFIFQRSANWMMPKRDRAYSEAEKRRFARHPLLARLYRWWIYLLLEMSYPVFRQNRFLGKRMEALAKRHMRARIADPELRAALVPDYPIGGKRVLISDDYYPCLEGGNVEVVTEAVDHLTADSIVARDGAERAVDAVIFATGFESTSFLAPMEIVGVDGCSLASEWKDGARAYLGMAYPGFPNFFMMYGPNTNLGHNSIIFMIECQARYIVDCIRKLVVGDIKYVDLRQSEMDAFDERIQKRLEGSTWAETGKSWYKTADGRITNNWAGTTIEYWWRTRRADLRAYRCEPR